MDESSLVVGALLMLLALAAILAVRARYRSWRAVRRARRASRGERRAEKLLRNRGFRIEARQKTLRWAISVDGQPHYCQLRADLLVEKSGRRFVAEVKTGALAPRPSNVSTRRQLLEYLIAYRVDGVLLVAPERRQVVELGFPMTAAAMEWADEAG
ncbi:MAG: hypothetical protein KJO07_04295 [Deltaproteobacteria bacterium]|jgi:hypothetical protein|nr:hypothetical protein [Deltaproteobacteria bacterium]